MQFSQQQIDAGLQVQPGGSYGLVQKITCKSDAEDKLAGLGIEYKMALWGRMPPKREYSYWGAVWVDQSPTFLHFFSEAQQEVAYWCRPMETLVVLLKPRIWGEPNFKELTN